MSLPHPIHCTIIAGMRPQPFALRLKWTIEKEMSVSKLSVSESFCGADSQSQLVNKL